MTISLREELSHNNYIIGVHSLKNTSKTIGLNELSEEAKTLELAGRNNEIATIEAGHEALLKHLQEKVDALQAAIN